MKVRPNFCYTKTRNNNDDSGQALRTDRAHQPGARRPTHTKTLNGQKQAQSEANPVVSGRGDGMLDASLALLLGTNNAVLKIQGAPHTRSHDREQADIASREGGALLCTPHPPPSMW